jgi:predicted chitinase
MPIQLTEDGLRAIFPKAPQAVLDAFLAKQDVLTKSGVNHTRSRLAHFFANIEHETNGFAIKNLTENINYSPDRAAAVWPNRFWNGDDVRARFGSAPGWQLKMFDQVYGNRMGNRPGTNDGSRYIGRGGPQWTGRDGYAQVQQRTGLPALDHPEVVARYDMQPEVCCAFVDWKKLNPVADVGDSVTYRKRWNGGLNGFEDVQARQRGNDRPLNSMPQVDRVKNITKSLPGKPPTEKPPKDTIDQATEKEKKTGKAGGATAAGGAAGQGANAGTQQPDKPPLIPEFITWTLIGVGVGLMIYAAIMIAKKRAAIIANWN